MLRQATPAADPSIVRTVVAELFAGIVAVLPKMLAGVVFLTLAYVGITVLLPALQTVLSRVYPAEERLVVDLAATVASLFLWFAAGLALLKILEIGDVAASLGTAAGFIGLGVAFALKEMIADTVAGVYLLQDPDFQEGDRVTTASVTGTVAGIDLRKTRIRLGDGDIAVVANRDVEKKWTKETAPAEGEQATATSI